jgi:hypothetical protein
MDNNLTISTLSFVLRASDLVAGSERRETSRGVNLPEVMTIRSQETTNSKTKVKEDRINLRFDRHIELADGTIGSVAASLVVIVPKDSNVTSADVLAVIARINGVIDATSPNLDLGTEIFVNREQ